MNQAFIIVQWISHAHSSEASSPPDVSAASTPAPIPTRAPNNRKRKHAAISGANSSAASPAPSDPGVQPEGSLLLAPDTSAPDTLPRLKVSRPPIFVPGDDSPYHTTDQIAVNRRNFRYIPAGFTEPGSKIHCRTIESSPEGYVRVSWEDRSPFVKVTKDGLGLCGEKGYRSARLNVPVREGKWYLEIKVELGGGALNPDSVAAKDGAHVRLGWGRREAMLNCPVGLDGYSYGILDKSGHKVTLSRPRPYGQSFGTGDVIGMYISLPPKRKVKDNDPYDPAHLKRERIAIDFKGQPYFESIEYPQSKEMMALMDSVTNKQKATSSTPTSTKKSATVKNVPERGRANKPPPEPSPLRPLPVLRGSSIAFFVNGVSQGIAFQDIYDYLQLRTVPSARKDRSRRRLREGYVEHTENPFDDGWLGYYPFISLFNGARVRINPGPDFEFTPPPDIEGHLTGDPDSVDTKERTWRPLCERYAEHMQEQWDLDAKEEAEAQELAQKPPPKERAPPPPVAERPSRTTQHKSKAQSRGSRGATPRGGNTPARGTTPTRGATPNPNLNPNSNPSVTNSVSSTTLSAPQPVSVSTSSLSRLVVAPSTPDYLAPSQLGTPTDLSASNPGPGASPSQIQPQPDESGSLTIMVPIAVPVSVSVPGPAPGSGLVPAPAPVPAPTELTPEQIEKERKIALAKERKRIREKERRARIKEEKLRAKAEAEAAALALSQAQAQTQVQDQDQAPVQIQAEGEVGQVEGAGARAGTQEQQMQMQVDRSVPDQKVVSAPVSDKPEAKSDVPLTSSEGDVPMDQDKQHDL